MQDKVILVDENDTPLGEIEKLEAHQKALLHRAVSVFVFNTDNKLLLQKRALNKYHSPGLWSNTACTHPAPHESNEEAAIRRLKEEMGLTLTKITKLFHFIYKEQLDNGLFEHELDHVFIGFSEEWPVPAPNEVSDFDYVEMHEVLEQVKNHLTITPSGLKRLLSGWLMKFAKKTATYGTVNKQPNNPGFERPWILSGEKSYLRI